MMLKFNVGDKVKILYRYYYNVDYLHKIMEILYINEKSKFPYYLEENVDFNDERYYQLNFEEKSLALIKDCPFNC